MTAHTMMLLPELANGQPCHVPTYDGSNECTHPSIVDSLDVLGRPWHGYRYWMAFTPYPGNNPMRERFENPSIVASHDADNWVVPGGVENPIIPAPGFWELVKSLTPPTPLRYVLRYARGTLRRWGYNADPTLYLSRAGTMYMAYTRSLGGWVHDELLLVASTDGWRSIAGKRTLVRRWEERRTREINVPSIVEQRGSGPRLSLYYGYVPIDVDGRPRYDQIGIRCRSGPSLEALGAPADLRIEYPAGQRLWHHEVRSCLDGRRICLGTFSSRADSAEGVGFPPLLSLYYGEFVDSHTVVFDNRPMLHPSSNGWDSRCIYKPSFLIRGNGRNETIQVWYSAQDAATRCWRIGTTRQAILRGERTR